MTRTACHLPGCIWLTPFDHMTECMQIPRNLSANAGAWGLLTLHCGGVQKQQALLGQMLQQGYGCKADVAAGKDWADKARRRGYRMSGVYCEL